MRKFGFLAGVLLLASLAATGRACAEQRTHRPWFSVKTPLPLAGEGNKGQVLSPGTGQNNRGDKVVRQALRYRGARYRFGGKSKSTGFDCSGLVMRVYNDLKFKKLPHTSSALFEMGKPVPMKALKPGDLVFFKNTYRRGISHVGVYAGSNRFVHALNHHRGVTISLLSDPYFQLHYAGARRLY